ncbi:hypothetical protein DWZ56_04345 [Lachnotalea sp. AF33-28]|nr:hypothetical protein DWZ56_04345 [Lachnotalea sp. AF33-28]
MKKSAVKNGNIWDARLSGIAEKLIKQGQIRVLKMIICIKNDHLQKITPGLYSRYAQQITLYGNFTHKRGNK